MFRLIYLSICLLFFYHFLALHPITFAAPLPTPDSCGNQCGDSTNNNCTGPCTVLDQGVYCEALQQDPPGCSLNGNTAKVYVSQCASDINNNFSWQQVGFGIQEVTSSCCGYCSLPTPTPANGNACVSRPFQVIFKSNRPIQPGERIECKVKQNNQNCVPCQGLDKFSSCSFPNGIDRDGCTIAKSDCVCKPFSFECSLNGQPPFISGTVPNPVNLQTSRINLDPPGGSVFTCDVGVTACTTCTDKNACYPECNGGKCGTNGKCETCNAATACFIGKSCSSCINGQNTRCFPDCNGGACVSGKCSTCAPAGVTPPTSPTLPQTKATITFDDTFTPTSNIVPINPAKTQRWVCLSALPCNDVQSSCSINTNQIHRARISTADSAKLIPYKPSYIFECLMTVAGPLCTTGQATLDGAIFRINPSTQILTELNTRFGYQYEGIFRRDFATGSMVPGTNPQNADSKGDLIPHEWQSRNTGNAVGRVFLAMNEVDTLAPTTSRTTQVQQQFYPESIKTSSCTMIKWDPYGRVFDSKTLEPIEGATVTLLRKTNTGAYKKVTSSDVLGGIINPVITDATGGYLFMVPDGVYKLEVKARGYRFPSKNSALNPQYTKIYTDIYRGEEIKQDGTIEHRDIPLDPEGNQAKQSKKSQLLTINQTIDPKSENLLIEGVVTHPLSTIEVKTSSSKGSRVLMQKLSDRYGRFTFSIPQKEITSGEYVSEVNVIKYTELYTAQKSAPSTFIDKLSATLKNFVGDTRAEPVIHESTTIEPLLTHLKGAAYNDEGMLLTNTPVAIYLTFATQPYTTTKTDEYGSFELGPDKLPSLPYVIRYIQGSKVTTKTPSQFLHDNTQ